MRHGKKFNHLSRTAPHRKAMLANMASSLIASKRITTTVAKAKALRQYVEPLLTKSKEDTTHNRRIVFSYLKNKESIKELFDEIGAKIASRPGGYTRIIKLGSRLGDDAEMALIELVDYNENLLGEKAEKKKPTTRRSRRGGGSKETAEKKSNDVEAKDDTEKKSKAKKSEAKEVKAESSEDSDATATEPKAKKAEDKKSEDSDDKKEDA
ncbi:50S ribosomal protein L17 [Marivirga sp. S37H4]|uniref:Large ribosomal subunit protein bL17 n=1 Tax=Marivirga aurantiaca TaxID=2802615 RepID=A0A934X2M1_9BACT|nr:50S ribosomal protein L17 [Marivirga aurantiaca]MBK6267240.1 50S ribosomal protein L17 [Marivirga aurantiaca]